MSLRSLSRSAVSGLVAGATLISAAWAGVALVPVEIADTSAAQTVLADAGVATLTAEAGELLVGASRVSLYPDVEEARAGDHPDAVWETDFDACATLSPSLFTEIGEDPEHGAHIVGATTTPWPENPDCLYMGGFGIGPMNPITGWDLGPDDEGHAEYVAANADSTDPIGLGLHARSVAISDGDDTLVMTILDAEGYLWDYNTKCDDCGAKQLTESIGAELGIDPAGIVIASTHAHSSMDFLGGWGFVPDWYMDQVGERIRESISEAVSAMEPAAIEVGEELARDQNRERRDTYRSAEEQQLAWLRAVSRGTGDVIATVGSYAAHPTSMGTNDGVAHGDWPAAFAAAMEERHPGSVGLHFMSGLGNMSTRGGVHIGRQLAAMIPEVGAGAPVVNSDVSVARTTWVQPATNVPLSALAVPGFFDRAFVMQPTTITTGQEPETAPCVSAAPYGVELASTSARIGDDFALSTGPGEIFSNLTNTVKENSAGATVAMAFGNANDALGYMPQQFEINEVGQQGLGFALGGFLFVNYEDSYAIDRCTGDMIVETAIAQQALLASD